MSDRIYLCRTNAITNTQMQRYDPMNVSEASPVSEQPVAVEQPATEDVTAPVTETEAAAPKAKPAPRKPKAPATEAKAGPEVLLLECKKVAAPKVDKGLRTFNKEFAENLAGSIRVEGMYNPVIVRPDPEKDGHYIVVQGKHRLYATKIVLKEQFIAAQVVEGMDEAEAEFAMITENLWQNPLTKGQQTLSVKKWFEYYQTKFVASAAVTSNFDIAVGENSTDIMSVKVDATADPIETGDFDVRKRITGFTVKLAASMGVTKRQAERELRIAKAFTEDQLQVLEQEKVTKESREHIAKVKDEVNRAAIVDLIAIGMVADDAIKQVMKDNAPAPVNKKAKEAAAAKKAARSEVAKELSDDEWYATYCCEKAKLLADPTKYKVDAIYYRKVLNARAAFRTEVKAKVKAVKEGKILGPFYYAVNRLISISHPKDWALCGTCGGKGVHPTDETKKCPKCHGCCYELRTEPLS
jgi:hypothetical protein